MENELERLRREIDELDGQIMEALSRRMDISEKIGEYKRRCALPVFVPEREKLILEKASALAGEKKAENIMELYRLIMEQSRRCQEKENDG